MEAQEDDVLAPQEECGLQPEYGGQDYDDVNMQAWSKNPETKEEVAAPSAIPRDEAAVEADNSSPELSREDKTPSPSEEVVTVTPPEESQSPSEKGEMPLSSSSSTKLMRLGLKDLETRLVYYPKPDFSGLSTEEKRRLLNALIKRAKALLPVAKLGSKYERQSPQLPAPKDEDDDWFPRNIVKEDNDGVMRRLLFRPERLRAECEAEIAAGNYSIKSPQRRTPSYLELISRGLPDRFLLCGRSPPVPLEDQSNGSKVISQAPPTSTVGGSEGMGRSENQLSTTEQAEMNFTGDKQQDPHQLPGTCKYAQRETTTSQEPKPSTSKQALQRFQAGPPLKIQVDLGSGQLPDSPEPCTSSQGLREILISMGLPVGSSSSEQTKGHFGPFEPGPSSYLKIQMDVRGPRLRQAIRETVQFNVAPRPKQKKTISKLVCNVCYPMSTEKSEINPQEASAAFNQAIQDLRNSIFPRYAYFLKMTDGQICEIAHKTAELVTKTIAAVTKRQKEEMAAERKAMRLKRAAAAADRKVERDSFLASLAEIDRKRTRLGSGILARADYRTLLSHNVTPAADSTTQKTSEEKAVTANAEPEGGKSAEAEKTFVAPSRAGITLTDREAIDRLLMPPPPPPMTPSSQNQRK